MGAYHIGELERDKVDTNLILSLSFSVQRPLDCDDTSVAIYPEPLMVSSGCQELKQPLAAILWTLYHNSGHVATNSNSL